MRIKDFEKLIKTETPQRIIAKHVKSEIWLTEKQLDKVIELRGKEYWDWNFRKEVLRNGRKTN